MIHTIEIKYDLNNRFNITVEEAKSVVNTLNWSMPIFNMKFNPDDTNTQSRYAKINYPGINSIKLTRLCIPDHAFMSDEDYYNYTGYHAPDNTFDHGPVKLPYAYIYQLVMVINPYHMIHPIEKHTTSLYIPTAVNNQQLTKNFCEAIIDIFGDINIHSGAIYDIDCWNVHRIDYSTNLDLINDDTCSAFQKIIHKTPCDHNLNTVRKHTKKDSSGQVIEKKPAIYEQSSKQKNNSRAVLCYRKADEILNQDCLSVEDRRRLVEQNKYIFRFESQNFTDSVTTLMKRYNLKDRRVTNFLDIEIAYHELLKAYEKNVGFEDFYKRQQATAILRAAYGLTSKYFKLHNLLMLIAKSRSLKKAKENYTGGNSTIKERKVSGTDSTFRNHIKNIRALGINPIQLTDADFVTYIKNPIYQLHELYNKYKNIR